MGREVATHGEEAALKFRARTPPVQGQTGRRKGRPVCLTPRGRSEDQAQRGTDP